SRDHALHRPVPGLLLQRERLLLALQEQAGNRAVQRMVTGSRGPVVQRATGLAADVGGFVGGLAGVFDHWSDSGADATSRMKALAAAINAGLARVGVPKIGLFPGLAGTGGSVLGTFNPAVWILDVSLASLQRPALGTQERAELADTVLHESRHAEQFFRVARLLCARELAAASGKKKERRDAKTIAASVAKSLNMDQGVVETAQQQGGGLTQEEQAEADSWAKTIPSNDDVQAELKKKRVAWNRSLQDVQDFHKDYVATPKQPGNPRMPVAGSAFQDRFKELEKGFELAYAQYRQIYRVYQLQLSFEADAWQIGRAAHTTVAKQPPPDLDAKLADLRAPWDLVFANWRAWLFTAPPRPHRDPAAIQPLVQRHAIPAELEPLRDDVEPAS
ncbi:hypothetical protein, partial [Amycolatopsis pretoriensis]|uniref:hypothetical protein n=1 Tax=Amycolatopsis pretoriensis TaxID=218821 RepID=UPI0013023AAC